MKTIIERGASWTLEETKLLLGLWGQDLVQRQATNQKRTKEVYEKISEKFSQAGFERTADQVRTRVFNMIAEYRRILKDPDPERSKKCIFFQALHQIYQAKHLDDVKSALDDYEPDYPHDSQIYSKEDEDASVSDGDPEKESSATNSTKKVKLDSPKDAVVAKVEPNTPASSSVNNQHATTGPAASSTPSSSSSTVPASSTLKHQSLLLPNSSPSATTAASSTPLTKITTSGATTPSYININSTKLPIIRTNQLIGPSNGNDSVNGRLPTTAAISHQLYPAPVNTFDVTSSALLIDRMFAHLSRESENMREWIALEKERLAFEKGRRNEDLRLQDAREARENARRAQDIERENKREEALIRTLTQNQEQWMSYIRKLDPRILENSKESPPELKLPPRENSTGGDSPNCTTQPDASKQ